MKASNVCRENPLASSDILTGLSGSLNLDGRLYEMILNEMLKHRITPQAPHPVDDQLLPCCTKQRRHWRPHLHVRKARFAPLYSHYQ